METTHDVHALTSHRTVSRRRTLQGLGGAGFAAFAFAAPCWAGATSTVCPVNALFASAASADDPAPIIDAYIAAVNAGDLAAILALYAEEAVHIFLPTPDGSAGVCHGKGQFQMWYEQSVANSDRLALVPESLAVAGNQATFVARLSSAPWQQLGVKTLEAHSELVIIDGQIMTHVVILSPESMRMLEAARGAA